MVTPSSFRVQFPEFANLTDTAIQTWIDRSDAFFDVTRWDDLLDLGVACWVAHQLALSTANATTQITDDTVTQKAGEVSYQRDAGLVGRMADNPYLRTTYGQLYLYYMKFVGAGGVAL